MFKKMILFAVFTGLTIVATRMGVEAIAAAKVWTPYTATTAHTKYSASTGKVLEVDVGKRAARRNGSHIMERALPSFIGPDGEVRPSLRKTRVIIDVAQGQRISLDEDTTSKTTYRLNTNRAKRPYIDRGPGGNCADIPATTETDTMLGFEVRKIVKDFPSTDDRKVRVEAWLAPALNCDPLKVRNLGARNNGPFFVIEEIVVSSVELGEPDRSLFDVPVHYVERSPSEVQAEYARRFSLSTEGQCDMTAVDAAYFTSRGEPIPVNTP